MKRSLFFLAICVGLMVLAPVDFCPQASADCIFTFGPRETGDKSASYLCEPMSMVLSEGDILAAGWVATLGLPHEYEDDYEIWDIEGFQVSPSAFGDGIPDLWQLALFADNFCNGERVFHDEAVAKYEANMAYAVGDLPESAPYVEWFVASSALSSDMRDTVCPFFGVDPAHYTPVRLPGNVAADPFSAQGDCDGDGVSNLDEYHFVVGAGGDIEDFVSAASENNPFWNGNPDLPVGQGAPFVLAVFIVVVASVCLKRRARQPQLRA